METLQLSHMGMVELYGNVPKFVLCWNCDEFELIENYSHLVKICILHITFENMVFICKYLLPVVSYFFIPLVQFQFFFLFIVQVGRVQRNGYWLPAQARPPCLIMPTLEISPSSVFQFKSGPDWAVRQACLGRQPVPLERLYCTVVFDKGTSSQFTSIFSLCGDNLVILMIL